MDMQTKFSKFTVMQILRLGTVGCALLVIIGEIIARFVIGLGTPPLSIVHPTIEYMFKPNQDVRRFHKTHYYNRFGMRSEDFESDRSNSNELRIFVLGDSVLNGGNLTDQRDLATAIIDRELEATGQFDNVVVGNISAGSWGPGNQLAYVQEFGLFDADIVVLVISSHDYFDVPTFDSLKPGTHPTSTPISAVAEGVQRYLPRYIPAFGSPDAKNMLAKESDAETTSGDIRKLLQVATQLSSRCIVVQYLSRGEIQTGQFESGFSEIKSICSDLGLLTLTTKESFADAVKNGLNPFRDLIHPNDAGQRLLADVILRAILHSEDVITNAAADSSEQRGVLEQK